MVYIEINGESKRHTPGEDTSHARTWPRVTCNNNGMESSSDRRPSPPLIQQHVFFLCCNTGAAYSLPSICTNMSPKNVVYKKICKDNSVGVYMGRRDFVDRVDSVDPVDGVIIIDPQALQRRKGWAQAEHLKQPTIYLNLEYLLSAIHHSDGVSTLPPVFVTLSCTFRYGRDDMDVMGIAFRRELYLATRQVYPPLQDLEKGVHTRMQAKLLHKLGNNAYPFFFEFPDNLPCSVALQPGPNDVGKQCAVEFEIKAFSAESQDAKVRKRSTVKLLLRKVQYAPDSEGVQPSVDTPKDFVMSDKQLHLKASLDKEIYYHGEVIKVNVSVTNNSSKNIKNIIVSVDQIANVVLYSNDSYIECVSVSSCLRDSVSPGATLQKVYKLLPLLANNTERKGIALDGKLKHEDTNLASSSIIKEGVLKEVMGIMVSYRVMVKLIVGGIMGSSEVGLEVPFKLMHPKPDAVKENEEEDELEFQEFKRSYLKGMVDDEDEDGNVSGGDDMEPKEK
ncbi:S-arrestin [Perca flavescens]|uniref:S-arrestin n=1 Tax=Perca flavescens TaxID=8167 RepID=UPI00106E2BC1|nr:S-arrestin-like [Perca flavescens]